MFKRLLCLAVLLTAAAAPESIEAASLDRVSVRLDLGTMISLHGRYSESTPLRDMVLPGAGFGLSLRYRVTPFLLLEAGYSYNWMFIQKDKRPSAYTADKPALVLPLYSLNGTLLMSQSESVRPYFTLGGGLCPWRFASQAIRGEIWPAPLDENDTFSKNSLILDTGLGLELIPWSRLSFVVEAKYFYLFSQDAARFGTEGFGQQGFLGVRLGIIFSFGSQKSHVQEEEGVE
jgi:Outer membrane protein beta-barrel domain